MFLDSIQVASHLTHAEVWRIQDAFWGAIQGRDVHQAHTALASLGGFCAEVLHTVHGEVVEVSWNAYAPVGSRGVIRAHRITPKTLKRADPDKGPPHPDGWYAPSTFWPGNASAWLAQVEGRLR